MKLKYLRLAQTKKVLILILFRDDCTHRFDCPVDLCPIILRRALERERGGHCHRENHDKEMCNDDEEILGVVHDNGAV